MLEKTLLTVPLFLAPVLSAQELEYKSAPQELGHDAPRVGEWIPDLAVKTAGGDETTLAKVAGKNGLLIAVRDAECPLSKRYGPRLAELEKSLARRGIGVLYASADGDELSKQDAKTHELSAPYAVDAAALLSALKAKTTTEVFLLDARRTLRYRGMIDDQYGLGFAKEEPTHRYLADAVEAVLEGADVRSPATFAQGCLLDLGDAPAPEASDVTYHERISRIVQSRCLQCHRTGGSAPFALETYEQVKKKKGMIAYVLEDGIMPPWFAEHGVGGPWLNDSSLKEAEKEDLLAWAEGGTPEGDPAHAPLPRTFAEGWTIGEPDLVVPLPSSFDVPSDGVVDYQYFFAKVDLPEDKWVQAVQLRPGAIEVVHHVLILVHERKEGEARPDLRGTNAGDTYFAVYVPGQAGLVFPDGYAKKLPAKSWITFQMHYTPNGEAATDRSEAGFVFATEPVHHEIRTNSAINERFAIPPETFDHEVTAEFRFPEDASILSLFPHTHLRGNRFHISLRYPDGHTDDLLSVPFYDFNWQLNYELQEPLKVPAGTTMLASAWYDNTAENPANPDPTQWVRFGEQTWEEMMIAYVNWVATDSATEGGSSGGQ